MVGRDDGNVELWGLGDAAVAVGTHFGFRVQSRLGFCDHSRDINPRNQRALTLLGLLLERSLILFTLGQKS